MNWIQLESISQLDELEKESANKPILIFKHSTRCPVSFAALNKVESESNILENIDFKAYYLDLISFRAISNEIASRYNVEHQSPQVIILKDKKATYNNSHMGINNNNLKKALL